MSKNTVIERDIVLGYREARVHDREVWRRVILDAAGRILGQEGISELTMRRLAREVDCSTTVLYTMFGSKEGLVGELYREGFARLQRAFEEIPRDEYPFAYLRSLGRAYRANALANPTYYAVMFERAIPGFTPPDAGRMRGHLSFQMLVDAVRACIDAGARTIGSPEEIADLLWTAVHGMVGLELAGYFPDPDEARQRFELMLRSVEHGMIHE